MLRIHYSADPEKDPLTEIGHDWYREALRGKPGGFSGPGWQSEMEISFNVFTGKPVYPKFSIEAHVAKEPIKPVRGVPILRGIDGGLTPACSFSQLTNEPRWLIFPSLHTSGREGVGMTRFGQEFVAYSAMTYPGFSFINYCDPACFNRAETDEKTNAMILASIGVHVNPGVVGSMTRDEIVRVQLERMIDGKAFVQVCPTATFDIQGFSGGFQYKRIGQTNIYMEEHDKNEWSHAMEATQYVASRIFDARDPQGRTNRRNKGGFKNWSRKPKRYI